MGRRVSALLLACCTCRIYMTVDRVCCVAAAPTTQMRLRPVRLGRSVFRLTTGN